MKIVIPGGAGQVGRLLAAHFHEAGHSVTVLSRQPHPAPWQMVAWNGRDPGDWHDTVHGADLVINLAGRSVNCRYNPRNRREILDSRVQSTEAVGRAIARAAAPPAIWMNASTATIYRHVFARPMDESSGELGGSEPDAPASWRFSIQVATSWERAFFAAATPHTRRIALRSAMIMSPEPGGIFATLLALVRAGLGGAAGSGRQFISWIHYQDFLGAVEHLIAHTEIAGVVNLCAPAPLPNREFMRMLREAARVRIGLPGPKPLLELGALFLRTETELILKSRRVIPARLAGSGFMFRFPAWREAAEDLLREVLQRDSD
ncbi:MAG TPA: TIGR01777 family oxidoreductase [Bryobacteraceae bacterium]|nr:TIGR01777 family oxidoreductase [Bryobacteraceae bacterium]